ncbi:hypothetical protein [Dictyobacter aurantiacus]|uniref:Uncharacterized protein n=1 Tax=Dictyobacter aurantiacus TaxID=1936993 RepID=A0A401ZR97_9CHLR|nr:hypothetical protein [Dictyobacter aurantiacus]GCE09316.1 hypothetical protein KDAU_66450 [Dictyobacter aurantiacus]
MAGAELSTLARLIDQSLVRRNTMGRYEVHELLRQYGAEHLEAAGQTEAVQQRYLAYYLKLLAQRERDIKAHHRTGKTPGHHESVGSTRFLHGNVGGATVTAAGPSGPPDALRTNLLQWVESIREAPFVVCHTHHASILWLRQTKVKDNST